MAKVTTKAPQEVAEKRQSQAVEAAPSYIQGHGLGNENVGAGDVVVPRLGIIQGLSPEIDADTPKYIPGAELGMLFHSLSRELFEKVLVVNVAYNREYPVFKKRKDGGGFKGTFDSEKAAAEFVRSQENPSTLEVIEMGNHFCYLLSDDADEILGEIVIACSSTKLKFSRQWNSHIRMRGHDRFAFAWEIGTAKEKNDKGTFYNYSLKPRAPFVSESIYTSSLNLYKNIQQGLRSVDHGDGTDDEGMDADSASGRSDI